jgi:hypothetical protein
MSNDKILNLPLPHGMERVETQAISFGDDWAGMFLRGDKAFAISNAMLIAAKTIKKTDAMNATLLEHFATKLTECIKK